MKKFLFLLLICFLIPFNIKGESIDLAPNATSAIIIEASTGTVIYSKNEHEKLAPASMTKMMGLLLIMEQIDKGNLKWDEMITASSNASSMGGSQIFLETGEQMSVEDLVKGISISSGNDAMVAMAERIAGTEAAFVELMNKKASELGLKNTNFKNSTGLDDENHYSSANDMALIAKELVKHEKILEFSGTYEDYIREGTDKSFWLVNTNRLVRFYQGVDGLKTGYTSTAGYCLTATAMKNNMRLITVVMNEPDSTTRNNETTSMLDYGFNTYGMEQLLNKDNVLGKIKVDLGEKGFYLTNGSAGSIMDLDPQSISDNSCNFEFLSDVTGQTKIMDMDYKYIQLPYSDRRFYGMSKFNKFEYGYAITTHLSQGSQYPKVLFIDEKFGSLDDRKKMRYTAITRAMESITILTAGSKY